MKTSIQILSPFRLSTLLLLMLILITPPSYSDVNKPNEILGMFRIMQDVETLDINIEFSDLLNKYYNYKK